MDETLLQFMRRRSCRRLVMEREDAAVVRGDESSSAPCMVRATLLADHRGTLRSCVVVEAITQELMDDVNGDRILAAILEAQARDHELQAREEGAAG